MLRQNLLKQIIFILVSSFYFLLGYLISCILFALRILQKEFLKDFKNCLPIASLRCQYIRLECFVENEVLDKANIILQKRVKFVELQSLNTKAKNRTIKTTKKIERIDRNNKNKEKDIHFQIVNIVFVLVEIATTKNYIVG